MKRTVYIIFAAIFVFAATLTASAQSAEKRQVSGFNGIASSGPFSVHVNINGTESLKISAKPEIINLIETVVENGTLKIGFKNHLERGQGDSDAPIDVYVTARSLKSLTNAGSGSIKVKGTVSGGNVDVTMSGSGNIESGVKAGGLHAVISGSGTIKLNGSADEARIVITGSGIVNAHELKTNSASVLITGSGSAYFTADKTLSAHIVGSGNVVYSGNATITNSRTIGSGRVSKAD